MSRLALSDSDKVARDWFVKTTESLGCKTTIDQMGNTFAVRPGIKEGPPTFCGSHLDTQPTGGRYDGILGVHAGIEALRTMNDHDVETEYPTGVINWTNEEGARFPLSMAASGVVGLFGSCIITPNSFVLLMLVLTKAILSGPETFLSKPRIIFKKLVAEALLRSLSWSA
jgi:hypothetical protein